MVTIAVSFLVMSMASLAMAQIPSLGWCPEYLPMADFDMNRYLGKWYEAERYFTFSELASRCVTTDYAKTPGGKIQLSNEITNRLTGVKRVIGGNLEVVGRDGEGKLHIRLNTLPVATESTLVVLDTDYDAYSVVWSCSGIGPVHSESAWVMTRDRLPSGSVLQKAYGVLDKFKISRTFFVKTDQEGCAIAASEINAANGITGISTIQGETNEALRSSVPEPSENSVKVPEPVVAAVLKPELQSVEEPVPVPDVKADAEPAEAPAAAVGSEPEPAPAPAPVPAPAPAPAPAPVVPVPIPAPVVPVPLPAPIPAEKKPVSVAEHILNKVEAPVAPIAAEKVIVDVASAEGKPVEPIAPSVKSSHTIREAHKHHKQ